MKRSSSPPSSSRSVTLLSLALSSVMVGRQLVPMMVGGNFAVAPHTNDATTLSVLDSRERPYLAWLLSFPNSGTSYTMTLVERGSGFATATHYGRELARRHDYRNNNSTNPTRPVHWLHPEGPYARTDRPLPPRYILTKTHCGGRCVKCPARDYMVHSAEAFLRTCARTTSATSSRALSSEMNPRSRVVRAIHLIRHPLDNLISRFHLESKNWNHKGEGRPQLEHTPSDFRTYCNYLSREYPWEPHVWQTLGRQHGEPSLVEWMQQIPCAPEVFKYVQWHNYVHEILPMLAQESPPDETFHVMSLYYEDFATDWKGTTQLIWKFLGLTNRTSSNDYLKPFRPPPSYDDHFTASERQAVARVLRTLASADTWRSIRHYVREYL